MESGCLKKYLPNLFWLYKKRRSPFPCGIRFHAPSLRLRVFLTRFLRCLYSPSLSRRSERLLWLLQRTAWGCQDGVQAPSELPALAQRGCGGARVARRGRQAPSRGGCPPSRGYSPGPAPHVPPLPAGAEAAGPAAAPGRPLLVGRRLCRRAAARGGEKLHVAGRQKRGLVKQFWRLKETLHKSCGVIAASQKQSYRLRIKKSLGKFTV